MPSFKDSAGRDWTVAVNVLTIKRIREAIDVDLMRLDKGEPGEPSLATRLATDPVLVCEVLYAVIKPQLDLRGITDEQFCEHMDGEATCRAYEAFCEALELFFRSLGRTELAQVLRKGTEGVRKTVKAVTAKVEAIDLDKLIERTLGSTSTSLPGSQESTPTTIRGAS